MSRISDSIQKRLLACSKELNSDKFISPINDTEEKKKFFDAYRKGIEYNPQYKYKIPTLSIDKIEKRVLGIKTNDKILKKLRERLLLEVYFIRTISDDNFSIIMNGLPNDTLVNMASKQMTKKKSKRQKRYIKAEIVKEIMEERLASYGIVDWSVKISRKIVANAVSELSKKTLSIKRRNYSESELKSLLVHEIDTHILRSVNGENQKYHILGVLGMPYYLKTEEGLAIYMEELAGVHSKGRMRFMMARVIACNLALKYSFYHIFKELHEKYKFSMNNAYLITKRVKRGLRDTSKAGGYIKDHLYFEGYMMIKEYVEKGGDIRVLWAAKIGLDDLYLIKDKILKKPTILPTYFSISKN